MCPEKLPTSGFETMKESLAAGVATARSLRELQAWLKSQPCIISVELAGYMLKSNPPQRDLAIEFRMDDGSTATKILNIAELSDVQFQLRELRDP